MKTFPSLLTSLVGLLLSSSLVAQQVPQSLSSTVTSPA